MDRSPPRTPEQWWANLDAAWEDIQTCFALCKQASDARASSAKPRPVLVWDSTIREALAGAREARQHADLRAALQNLWARAPDDPAIRKWPSWQTICDLCSEYPAIFPDD